MTTGAPTVYFIDDSATMREVIKIAFRRENMNVVACHDGATALAEMERLRPDVVISDVIMPEKDGYEVCQHIKKHPSFAGTPVILLSGVVNRAVAERACAVKADELLRKPFQPQDLVARVKHLLNPRPAVSVPPAAAATANAALSSIFSASLAAAAAPARSAFGIGARPVIAPAVTATTGAPAGMPAAAPVAISPSAAPLPQRATNTAAPARSAMPDQQKFKLEILRLQGLVRKLQSELEAEREYSRALEAHIKTLQEAE